MPTLANLSMLIVHNHFAIDGDNTVAAAQTAAFRRRAFVDSSNKLSFAFFSMQIEAVLFARFGFAYAAEAQTRPFRLRYLGARHFSHTADSISYNNARISTRATKCKCG